MSTATLELLTPETQLILATIICPECKGSGYSDYEYVDVRRFYDPFQTETSRCRACGGSGEQLIEVCNLCQQGEATCQCG
jgi:DnaJ-class molecular chaperone